MYMSKKQRNEIAELIKGYALFDRYVAEEVHKDFDDVDYDTLETWQRLRQREIEKLAELGINL